MQDLIPYKILLQKKLLELESQLMKNKMERTIILRKLRHYREIGKKIQTGIGLRPEVKHGNGLGDAGTIE